jgi:hypothetical protein
MPRIWVPLLCAVATATTVHSRSTPVRQPATILGDHRLVGETSRLNHRSLKDVSDGGGKQQQGTVMQTGPLPAASVELRAAIVYVAVRWQLAKFDAFHTVNEVHLSIASACDLATSPQWFIVFVSTHDKKMCSPNVFAKECAFREAAEDCVLLSTHSHVIQVEEMNDVNMRVWFAEKFDVLAFSHHAGWPGYAKCRLPDLLHRVGVDRATFVDTDTIWTRDPNVVFSVFDTFNASQSIGALRIGGSFSNRMSSGMMLIAIDRLVAHEWENALAYVLQI